MVDTHNASQNAYPGLVPTLLSSPPPTGSSQVAQWSRICLPSRRRMFDPWVRKIPWRRKWQHAPVFFPGKTHRQRSLAGYSPWGCKRVGHDLVTKQQNSNQLEFSAIHVHIYIHISRETFITNHVQAHFMNICSLILESFSEIHRVVLELGSSNSETPTHLFPANCSTFAF